MHIFQKNKKAVNTLYNVFTAFIMRQIIFKNTHIQVVEATRIELVSENPFMQLSTSVFYLLRFPELTADKRAENSGSPNTVQRHGHAEESFTVSQCPCESHGTQSQDSSRLRQLPVKRCYGLQ